MDKPMYNCYCDYMYETVGDIFREKIRKGSNDPDFFEFKCNLLVEKFKSNQRYKIGRNPQAFNIIQITVPNNIKLTDTTKFIIYGYKDAVNPIVTLDFDMFIHNSIITKNSTHMMIQISQSLFTGSNNVKTSIEKNMKYSSSSFWGFYTIANMYDDMYIEIKSHDMFVYDILLEISFFELNVRRFFATHNCYFSRSIEYTKINFNNKKNIASKIDTNCIGMYINLKNFSHQDLNNLKIIINDKYKIEYNPINFKPFYKQTLLYDNAKNIYNIVCEDYQQALYESLRLYNLPDEIIYMIEKYMIVDLHTQIYVPFDIDYFKVDHVDSIQLMFSNKHSGILRFAHNNVLQFYDGINKITKLNDYDMKFPKTSSILNCNNDITEQIMQDKTLHRCNRQCQIYSTPDFKEACTMDLDVYFYQKDDENMKPKCIFFTVKIFYTVQILKETFMDYFRVSSDEYIIILMDVIHEGPTGKNHKFYYKEIDCSKKFVDYHITSFCKLIICEKNKQYVKEIPNKGYYTHDYNNEYHEPFF